MCIDKGCQRKAIMSCLEMRTFKTILNIPPCVLAGCVEHRSRKCCCKREVLCQDRNPVPEAPLWLCAKHESRQDARDTSFFLSDKYSNGSRSNSLRKKPVKSAVKAVLKNPVIRGGAVAVPSGLCPPAPPPEAQVWAS